MATLDSISMKLSGAEPHTLPAAALALLLFEEDLAATGGALRATDAALGGVLRKVMRAERFEGKAGQRLVVPTLGRGRAERVVLLGLGPRATGAAGRLALALPAVASLHLPAAARAAVEGSLLGAYRFERYRARKKDAPAGLDALTLAVPAAAARRRDLVNLGPAQCTPRLPAEAAARTARRAGLACQVRGERQIAALKMGLFLGVTRGSAEPPRLVTLSWRPRGAGAGVRPVVLVGKAVTFDSGGLSLKPSDSMITMDTDMAGSAAVIAAMRVVAALRPAFPVIGVFGACENMPGGRAYKPSDVLAWSARTFKPAAMIDVATLGGAMRGAP